jgi:hypothetical protein
MNIACLLHHHWHGCTCERCGAVRDLDHDWNHCRCRRCGLGRSSDHDWQGCACSVCGCERHHWDHGVCTACGLHCNHVPGVGMDSDLCSQLTAHGRLSWVCAQCGMRVSVKAGASA